MINSDRHPLKYKTNDPDKCDYITLMSSTYSKPPHQADGKCGGYRNNYKRDLISVVCRNCINFDETLGGQNDGSL